MKTTFALSAALLLAASAGLTGCQTEPKTAGDKAALAADSNAALTSFTSKDPSLQTLLNKSVGYAIFPSVGKGGFIVGGSFGRGEVFQNSGGYPVKIGFADIKQGSVGLQAGAQTFSQLVIFMRQEDLDAFKRSDFSLGANASAVALKAGAAATTDTGKGVIIFVQTTGGLMAEAAVAGQVLSYQPL